MHIDGGFLNLAEAVSLFLLTAACVAGSRTNKRHLYLLFGGYALLNGIGLSLELAGEGMREFPRLASAGVWFRAASVLCLAEFGMIALKMKRIAQIPVLAVLAAGLCGLVRCAPEHLRLNIPVDVLVCLAALFAAGGLWRIGMERNRADGVIFLKIASIFAIAAGISFPAENTAFALGMPMVAGLFAVLRILCFLGISECLWLRIAFSDFPGEPGKRLVFWFPPFAAAVFLVLGFLLPPVFRSAGIRLVSKTAEEKAESLADGIKAIREKQTYFLDRMSREDWIAEMLRSPDKTLRADSRLQMIEPPDSDENTIAYLLDADGLCIDSSNRKTASSFLGSNFSFRKYFRDALENGSAADISTGAITHIPSFYSARRITDSDGVPTGILVIRTSLGKIVNNRKSHFSAVVSPDNIVIAENGVLPKSGRLSLVSGGKWTLPAGALKTARESDGFLFAELDCGPGIGVPGWRVVAGIETLVPDLMFTIGRLTVLGLWVLLLAAFTFRLVQLKLLNYLSGSMNWRIAVFNGNASGILVVGEDRKIVDVNDTLLRMFHCPAEVFMENGIEFLHANRDKGRLFAQNAYAEIEKNGSFSDIISTASPDGKNMWLRISGRPLPLRGGMGKQEKYTVWTVSGIDGEIRLRTELEQCRERYDKLRTHANAHIFSVDSRGVFLESNDPEISAAISVGGAEVKLSDYYDEASAAGYLKLISGIIATGRTVAFQRSVTFRGAVSERSETIYPLMENGIVTAIGVISRDLGFYAAVRTERNKGGAEAK